MAQLQNTEQNSMGKLVTNMTCSKGRECFMAQQLSRKKSVLVTRNSKPIPWHNQYCYMVQLVRMAEEMFINSITAGLQGKIHTARLGLLSLIIRCACYTSIFPSQQFFPSSSLTPSADSFTKL